jgi:hypothetical protein
MAQARSIFTLVSCAALLVARSALGAEAVVVAADTGDDGLLAREVRAELLVRGLGAEIARDPDTLGGPLPRAIVRIHAASVDITILEPSASASTHRETIASDAGGNRSLVAREVAEWLRARLAPAPPVSAAAAPPIAAAVPSAPAPQPLPRGHATPRSVQARLVVGPSVFVARGGAPAQVGGLAGVQVDLHDRWGFDAWGSGPFGSPSIERAEGSSSVRAWLLGAGPHARTKLGPASIDLSVGCALLALATAGHPAPPNVGASESTRVAMPFARLGSSIPAGPLALRVDLIAGAPAPSPAIVFAGSTVARIAFPVVGIAVGAQIDFGML